MNRQYLVIAGILGLGVFAGYFIQEYLHEDQKVTGDEEFQLRDQGSHRFTGDSSSLLETRRLATLEARVQALQSRIELIEAERSEVAPPQEGEFFGSTPFLSDNIPSQTEPLSMLDSLVFAGIDESSAEDITRRINESELKRLELRDKAIREDYIGTERYREELRSILDENTSVREEVGDEPFDRYLYAIGRANRVGITSVMVGSEAEKAGIEKGDQILSYGDQRMFDWSELRNATTQGSLGEYVDVRILRNGTEVMVSIPRGPLGVRLTSMSVDPDKS
jgi:hypothetical protein